MTVVCPGVTPVTPLSFVTDRSADALMLSVSVAELLPVLGSAIGFIDIVAVFESEVALDLTNPLSEYVTELPAGRSSESDMLPVPLDVLPAAPPVAVDDQFTPERLGDMLSVNVAPNTSDGPLLETTIT